MLQHRPETDPGAASVEEEETAGILQLINDVKPCCRSRCGLRQRRSLASRQQRFWRHGNALHIVAKCWFTVRERIRLTGSNLIQTGTTTQLRQIAVVLSKGAGVTQFSVREVTLVVDHFPLGAHTGLEAQTRQPQGFA